MTDASTEGVCNSSTGRIHLSLDLRVYHRDMIASPPAAFVTELAVAGSPGLATFPQDLSLIGVYLGSFELRLALIAVL